MSSPEIDIGLLNWALIQINADLKPFFHWLTFVSFFKYKTTHFLREKNHISVKPCKQTDKQREIQNKTNKAKQNGTSKKQNAIVVKNMCVSLTII